MARDYVVAWAEQLVKEGRESGALKPPPRRRAHPRIIKQVLPPAMPQPQVQAQPEQVPIRSTVPAQTKQQATPAAGKYKPVLTRLPRQRWPWLRTVLSDLEGELDSKLYEQLRALEIQARVLLRDSGWPGGRPRVLLLPHLSFTPAAVLFCLEVPDHLFVVSFGDRPDFLEVRR